MAGTASVRTIVTAVLLAILAAALVDAVCSRIHAQNVDRLFGVIIDQVERAAREKERRRTEKQPPPPASSPSSLGQIKSSPGNYAVGGILLGSQASKESLSARFPQVTCSVSSQFAPAEWCSGRETRPEARGQFTLTTSVLLSERSVVAYVNQSFSPAFFTPTEINDDIDRYSQAVQAAPRRMNARLPFVNGEASIAIWGDVQLGPISSRAIEQIRAKKSADEGILVDFLGDFNRSLDNGLPVYRVVSGHGYVWSGWRDQRGVGHLRSFAIDVSLTKSSSHRATPEFPSDSSLSRSTSDREKAEHTEQDARAARAAAEKAALDRKAEEQEARAARAAAEQAAQDKRAAELEQVKALFKQKQLSTYDEKDSAAQTLNASTIGSNESDTDRFWSRKDGSSSEYILLRRGDSLMNPIITENSIDFAKLKLNDLFIRQDGGQVVVVHDGKNLVRCRGCQINEIQRKWFDLVSKMQR